FSHEEGKAPSQVRTAGARCGRQQPVWTSPEIWICHRVRSSASRQLDCEGINTAEHAPSSGPSCVRSLRPEPPTKERSLSAQDGSDRSIAPLGLHFGTHSMRQYWTPSTMKR